MTTERRAELKLQRDVSELRRRIRKMETGNGGNST